MVTITEIAAKKGKEILSAEGKADHGIRIYLSEGGCCGPSYGMDIDKDPADGDEVIEQGGLKVFMDSRTFQALGDMKIDFIEEGEQSGFVLTGGQRGGCGSGCSSC